MQPSFGKDALEKIGWLSLELAQSTMEKWFGNPGGTSVEVDIDDAMAKLTLYVVAQSLFGAEVYKYADTIVRGIDDLLSISEIRIWSTPDLHWHWGAPNYWKFNKARHAIDHIINEFVERRKNGETFGHDLLGVLIAAMGQDTKRSITDTELRDEITTLLVTGHESTANTITWMLYEMAKNPEIQEAVHKEILSVFPDGDISIHEYANLAYTKAVVSETMRLYPAAWSMARKNLEDIEIHGTHIPKHSNLMLSPYLMHRHRKYYHNPEAFRPERFLNGEMDGAHPYIYFPFAGGPRRCIGEKFAWQEILSVICVLCKHLKFEIAPGQKVQPIARIAVKPAHGMRMVVTQR